MSKYRKVDPRILNDAKIRQCAEATRMLFLHLLIHPHMTPLGAMRATQAGLGAELEDWPSLGYPHAIADAMAEGIAYGLIDYDQKAHCLALPNFLKYNRPESINVVKAWVKCLDDIPECGLKTLVLQRAVAIADGMGDAFGHAIPDAIRDGIAYGMPYTGAGAGAGAGTEEKSAFVVVSSTPSPRDPGDWMIVIALWNKAAEIKISEPFIRHTSELDRRNAERFAAWWKEEATDNAIHGPWKTQVSGFLGDAMEQPTIYGKPRADVNFGFFFREEVWKSVLQSNNQVVGQSEHGGLPEM